MKKELLSSLILTFVSLILLCVGFPALIWVIAQASPGKGEGVTIKGADGKIYFENVGQTFTDDKYFWSRPSAVSYNAAATGGSNKGPSNPDYLATVSDRIDTFLAHNPGINRSDIPSDMVTASGSGLDPHISVQGAIIQVPRVARIRGLSENTVKELVAKQTEKPLLGVLGTERINVLKLNIALDQLK